MYGARISLTVGIFAQIINSVIGITLGLSAGYWGGWWDDLVTGLTNLHARDPLADLRARHHGDPRARA